MNNIKVNIMSAITLTIVRVACPSGHTHTIALPTFEVADEVAKAFECLGVSVEVYDFTVPLDEMPAEGNGEEEAEDDVSPPDEQPTAEVTTSSGDCHPGCWHSARCHRHTHWQHEVTR